MKKLFVNEVLQLNVPVFIGGDDYLHLTRSLRIRTGETFVIEDSLGEEYSCQVVAINSKCVEMQILSLFKRKQKHQFKLSLHFPILKGDRTELILQKGTEIGVDQFIPTITKNTIIQLDSQNNKLKRWQTILREAAMQSGRKGIPFIRQPVSVADILPLNKKEIGFMGTFDGLPWKELSTDFSKIEEVKIIIGPEGDFTEQELLGLKDKGFTAVNISDNILRSETACIFFVSILSMCK